jgi:hypothetical protein
MQPRGAITDLGEIRRKDHAPGVFICTPHADSVDSGVAGEWLFAAGACKMKITEIKAGIQSQQYVETVQNTGLGELKVGGLSKTRTQWRKSRAIHLLIQQEIGF